MNKRCTEEPSPCVLKILFAAVVVMLMLGSFACASGHRESFSEEQPEIRQVAGLAERISNAVNSRENLSLKIIGEVNYFDEHFPVWAVSVTPISDSAVGKVLILGGVHGNEPAGVEKVIRLIEELAENPGQYGAVTYDIIPVINPWGWSRDLRFNQQGIDVNRDFAAFESQEAVIISSFTAGTDYDLIIDCHEDPDAQGFYLYQYANPETGLSRSIIDAVRKLGFPIEQDVNMIILKTDDGLIDAPLWGLWYMKFTKQLSMTNYLRLNNSKQVYTVETPTSLALEDRLAVQDVAVRMLLESLAD